MLRIPFLVLAISLSAADSPDVPDLFGRFNDRPEWVSAHVAVRDGVLSDEHLGTYVPKLRKAAQSNPPAVAGAPANCRIFKGWRSEHFERRGSVDELTRSSKQVLSGRVVAVEEGFMRGMPGMLVRLAGGLLKGTTRSSDRYLFYPLAKIDTTDGAICAQPAGDFVRPEPGDRMLIFGIVGASESGRQTIFWADPSHELVHDPVHGGRRRLPNAIARSHAAVPFDEIERAVRRQVEVEQGQKP